jgi:anti-sigma factor RsiW
LNAIGELDLELLEDYLDDASSPAQVQHVGERLAAEPELASAMHELRAARMLRVASWRSLGPCETEAAKLADRVIASIRREDRLRKAWASLRVGSIAAALVGIFVIGWLLRGRASPSSLQAGDSVVQPVAVEHAVALSELGGPFHVALLDQEGRLVPVQKFSRADDARQFAHDLMQYEARARDAEQGSAMLVSDHF